MSVKQFKNDKNYILKKIQLETKDRLLKKLIKIPNVVFPYLVGIFPLLFIC